VYEKKTIKDIEGESVVDERFASPVISRRAKSLLKHLLEQLQVVQFSE
jgi:hypothetical protein